MNYKRKKPYRKIRCSLCTKGRTGNKPETKHEHLAKEAKSLIHIEICDTE